MFITGTRFDDLFLRLVRLVSGFSALNTHLVQSIALQNQIRYSRWSDSGLGTLGMHPGLHSTYLDNHLTCNDDLDSLDGLVGRFGGLFFAFEGR
jgi:hypothetical protein